MAQTLSSLATPLELTAMALPLSAIEPQELDGRQFGVTSNGTELWEPTFKGRTIVLDLAPGVDDFLNVQGVDRAQSAHFLGESAQALCMGVSLGYDDRLKLDAIDAKMKRVCNYTSIGGKTIWKNMHCGVVVLHLVLGDTAQPTVLKFVKDGKMLEGAGKDFLDSCLAGRRLEDFICKPKVVLECVHETPDYITITITVLSVIFVPAARRALVSHTKEDDAAVIQAVKRLKYQF
jgi:hypothetical protein